MKTGVKLAGKVFGRVECIQSFIFVINFQKFKITEIIEIYEKLYF